MRIGLFNICFLFSIISFPLFAIANDDLEKRIYILEQEIRKLKKEQQNIKNNKESKQNANYLTDSGNVNVKFDKEGLKISSNDNKYILELHGTFQYDARFFINDKDNTAEDEFVSRRLRPTFDIKMENVSLRFTPDFAGSTTTVADSYLDYKMSDALQLRVGKFKPPIGLERLQSSSDLNFVERGHPTNLAPNRDLGFMLHGKPNSAIEYQVSIINGNADGTNSNSDDDDKKDFVARIFTTPFANSESKLFNKFGFGIAGSIGEREGNTAARILGTYKTSGQQDFFAYKSTTYADGTHFRVYPQAYWYYKNFGSIFEYVISEQEITNGSNNEKIRNNAWQIVTSYVITGENASYRGGITPNNNLDLDGNGLGAWELVARIGETDIDNDAFPIYADQDSYVSKASSYGLGINWYPNSNLRFMVDYDFTKFSGGKVGGNDRADEQALFMRTQLSF